MELVKLEYLMNNEYEFGGRSEGYIEGGQLRVSMLVRGSNAFSPCLYLMM